MIDFHAEAAARLASLEDRDRLAAELDARRVEVLASVRGGRAPASAGPVARPRPRLAAATQAHLVELAMPKARRRGRGRRPIPATT